MRFGIGQKAMAPNVINCVIGEVLGYNKEEGFTIKPQALGGNSNVQVAVERGDVDIGIGVPSFGLPLLAKGEWGSAINFYQYTYPYKWDIVVKPGSPIKSYADLKGKKIGVSDFGGTEYPVTRNVLKSLRHRSGQRRQVGCGRQRCACRRRAGSRRDRRAGLLRHRLRPDRGRRHRHAVPAAAEQTCRWSAASS